MPKEYPSTKPSSQGKKPVSVGKGGDAAPVERGLGIQEALKKNAPRLRVSIDTMGDPIDDDYHRKELAHVKQSLQVHDKHVASLTPEDSHKLVMGALAKERVKLMSRHAEHSAYIDGATALEGNSTGKGKTESSAKGSSSPSPNKGNPGSPTSGNKLGAGGTGSGSVARIKKTAEGHFLIKGSGNFTKAGSSPDGDRPGTNKASKSFPKSKLAID